MHLVPITIACAYKLGHVQYRIFNVLTILLGYLIDTYKTMSRHTHVMLERHVYVAYTLTRDVDKNMHN